MFYINNITIYCEERRNKMATQAISPPPPPKKRVQDLSHKKVVKSG